jgi:hypothetical protein
MVHFRSLTFIYVFSGFSVKILLYSCQLTNLDAKTDDSKISDKNDAENNCGGQQRIKTLPSFVGLRQRKV